MPQRKRFATQNSELGDMGDEKEIFHTDSLPQTGHDPAIDDEQQEIRSASRLLASIAKVLHDAGQLDIARRASSVANRMAQIGIRETKTPNFTESYSTSILEEPLQDGSAIDDNEKPGKLQYFGVDAPKKDQVGPLVRKSSRKSSDREYLEGLDLPSDTSVDTHQELEITGCNNGLTSNRNRRAGDVPSDNQEAPVKKEPKKKTPPIESITMKFHRDAAPRKADPLPDYKQKMDHAMDDLSPDSYEAHEGDFHNLLTEIQDLEKVGEEAITTSMQYAGAAGMGDVTSHKKVTPTSKSNKRSKVSSRKASSESLSPWKVLQATLTKQARNGGRWASGSWESSVSSYGKTLDLNLETSQEDGAPLIAGTVSFSLLRENPKTRKATIEVNDGLIHNETREVELDARQAALYASEWAKETENTAKSILNPVNK